MINDYIEKYIQPNNYQQKLENYNVAKPSDEHVALIASYKTPNRSYVKQSARGINASDVDFDILKYICETCHQCSMAEKYEAIVVLLHKFYEQSKEIIRTTELKAGLLQLLNPDIVNNITNFSWLDDFSDGSQKIFYLLRIKIGSNNLIKYGISGDRLRNRLATLKSDIQVNYNNQSLEIEPLLLVACQDNETFEQEVQMLISENGLQTASYKFRGSNEVLHYKHKNTLLNGIVLPTVEKFKDMIVYDVQKKEKDKTVPVVVAKASSYSGSVPDDWI